MIKLFAALKSLGVYNFSQKLNIFKKNKDVNL